MAYELFFDLVNSQFVQAVDTPNQIAAPVFYADDIKPLLLKLVRRTSPSAVEVVDLTGVSVQMAIGTPAVSPTVITSATSGTVDAAGFLPISLPFNVAAVATALGTSPVINPTVELRVVSGSSPERYQTTCTLRQRLITGTLADPEAPLVATSLQEVQALMVPRDGSNADAPCSSFIMVDENDTSKLYRLVLRDGILHPEALQ